MNYIWDNIYIGDEHDASSFKLTRGFKILDLRELHIDEKQDLKAVYQIYHALSELTYLHNQGKVLVHCNAGIDRAPFVVALWFHITKGYDFDTSYDFVKKKRPQAIQHWEWYPSLKHLR